MFLRVNHIAFARSYSACAIVVLLSTHARAQVYFQGYHGDCSETFAAGQVDDEGMRLLQVKRNNIPERRIVHRV